MLASLRSAVNSSCCRCRTLPQQRFHRKLLQSRRGLLTRLQSRKIVAATGPSSDEPPQHGTTRLQPSPASWHHEARTSHVCPACGQRLLRLPVLERHFQKCCPDLISPHVWLSLSARCFHCHDSSTTDLCTPQALQATHDNQDARAKLIADATESELRLRKACVSGAASSASKLDTHSAQANKRDCRYPQLSDKWMSMDSQSGALPRRLQIYYTCQCSGVVDCLVNSLQCKQELKLLAVCRVRNAFKMAQRAIPLVADSDPVEAIYEDDDVIAVNKPAGVISAPKHRFTVSLLRFASDC